MWQDGLEGKVQAVPDDSPLFSLCDLGQGFGNHADQVSMLSWGGDEIGGVCDVTKREALEDSKRVRVGRGPGGTECL